MPIALKPLAQQTIVITGASSGIGLAAARRAAREGANVVLAARNEEALREAVDAIVVKGGKAAWIAIDIADEGAAEKIGQVAIERFGGFDTWVNDAAVALYAKLLDTTIEEQRRVFDVGYFALVEASLYATRYLTGRGGGALINIGSVLSERAVPIQGTYSAMKHAVLGFTEALRVELEAEDKPVSVTLIKPNGIDTPYPEHARNKLGKPARVPPVVYDPELVAKAICFAAAHRKRELVVGGQGFMLTGLGNAMPAAMDKVMATFLSPGGQTIDTPPTPGSNDNLFEPRRDGRERSNQDIYVRKHSFALEAQMRPLATAAIAGATVAGALLIAPAVAALLFARGHRRGSAPDGMPLPTIAHQADGTDSSASFRAGIADEGTIPEAAALAKGAMTPVR